MPNASCGATSNAEPRVRRSRPMSAGPTRPGCYEDEMTERAAPFYCPYCGDEDLRPFGERHGEWRCRVPRAVLFVRCSRHAPVRASGAGCGTHATHVSQGDFPM